MRILLISLALLIGSFALTACSTPPAAPTPTLVPLMAATVTATPAPPTAPAVTATQPAAPTLTPTAAATATAAPPQQSPSPAPTTPGVSPTPAQKPAAPPRATQAPAGKIVFQDSSGGVIYLVNADGSGLRRLTTGFDPALAPDGQRVAFTRWDEPRGVWIYDLRTAEEMLLAQANGPRAPTWSPDGSELAFAFWRKTIPGRQVCIGDFCFDIPPEDFNGLATVRVAEKILRDLPASQTVQSPTWAPNGRRIVYRGKQGLKFTEPGRPDAAEEVLTTNLFHESPAWSPDGQRLLVQTRLHDHRDIFMLDSDGRTVARLTAPDPLAGRPANNVAPAWSLNGRQVIFLSDRSGAWQVYVMEADGSNPSLFLPSVFGQIVFRYDFAAERMFDWGS